MNYQNLSSPDSLREYVKTDKMAVSSTNNDITVELLPQDD